MINVKNFSDLVPKSQPFILFIRHARRPELPLAQMVQNETLSILPEGAAEARQLGATLRSLGRSAVFFTSPLKRCVQTCQEILKGMAVDENSTHLITPSRQLGDPSAFVIDAQELGRIMRNYDNPIDFLRSWFRGDVPEKVILPPKKGSMVLLRWFLTLLEQQSRVSSRAIVACVSHDLIITAFLASLFGYDYEENGVVDYLDGAVLWLAKAVHHSTDACNDVEKRVVAYFSCKIQEIDA